MTPVVPHLAEVVSKRKETRQIYTLRLRFQDPAMRNSFRFQPGQFNMLYAYGMGEVPISIVSDPAHPELLDHTIRIVGAVSGALANLGKGGVVGLRGPYGSTWPLQESAGKDVIILTGGLGCAPVVSVINYVMNRRDSYGSLKILHGIKTPRDLLYRERFRKWQRTPKTEVYLTVDHPDREWNYHVGVVTNLFKQVQVQPERSIIMMCGPEIMMRFAVRDLLAQGVSAAQMYLSLERNMKCAVGFCGHCQFGPTFVCRDGPIYRYDRIEHWFSQKEI